MEFETTLVRWAVGSLGGLAVGIEREWSARRDGAPPPFAGVRTFLLLGLLGSVGATLASGPDTSVVGRLILGAGLLLVVTAYGAAAFRGFLESTTEVAGLLVLAAGALAGFGQLAGASAVFALTALVLVEKSRIHRAVERLAAPELEAAARFAVLALVILPLLPARAFGPEPGIVPRKLWSLVLVFAGVSFAGYLAMKWVGPGRGPMVAGLLGGLVSSTAVTLEYSRRSRADPEHARQLGMGILAACSVLPFRVLLLAAVVYPLLGARLLAPILPALLVASAVVLRGWFRVEREEIAVEPGGSEPSNPLRLRAAVEMALLFAGVLLLLAWMRNRFGEGGVLGSAALVGLTDLDALTYSAGRLAAGSGMLETSVRALLVGLVSNTAFKATAASLLGNARLRTVVLLGLGAQTGAFLLGLALLEHLPG